jgi:hypothetical protein
MTLASLFKLIVVGTMARLVAGKPACIVSLEDGVSREMEKGGVVLSFSAEELSELLFPVVTKRAKNDTLLIDGIYNYKRRVDGTIYTFQLIVKNTVVTLMTIALPEAEEGCPEITLDAALAAVQNEGAGEVDSSQPLDPDLQDLLAQVGSGENDGTDFTLDSADPPSDGEIRVC